MTIQPRIAEFTPNGEIRTADLLTSIAKKLARIRDARNQTDGTHSCDRWRKVEIAALESELIHLARTIDLQCP